MGKKRTIEDIKSKEYGHRKFAKVCSILLEQGHTVENIVEHYENFRFDVDGFWFEYMKDWNSSAKAYVDFLLNILEMKKIIAKQQPIKKFKL